MTDNVTPIVIKRRAERFKLGIVGWGFVGKAVDYAFTTDNVDKFIVDPKYNSNTLNDLVEWQPNIVFICAPTPSNDDGSVDVSIIRETVAALLAGSSSFIVIKSTMTPDTIQEVCLHDGRIVYNPEFLTESNSKADFVTSRFNLIGCTDPGAATYLEGVYSNFSICNGMQSITMSPVEASFFKYTLNTFLAMKVTYMNELKQVMDEYGGSFNNLSRALGVDGRMGHTHMKIPGTDGKKGFGGACFPKDLDAFIHFVGNKTSQDFTLLKEVREVNNKIRSQYELSEREIAQNVNYGQTKEELEDQDNGSAVEK